MSRNMRVWGFSIALLFSWFLGGCFFWVGEGRVPVEDQKDPIQPPSTRPPPRGNPPVDGGTTPPQTPAPQEIKVEWRSLPQLSAADWKTRAQGPGAPLLCRLTSAATQLYCFDRYSQSFVELFDANSGPIQGMKILSHSRSQDSKRLALLLKDAEGSLEIREARAPFLQFQTVRTFPVSASQPRLRHVAFLQGELIAYGKDALYSEKSQFLEPRAEEFPALGQVHYLKAGYYLAIDAEHGHILQNAPTSLGKWTAFPPPRSDDESPTRQLATDGTALAILQGDGALYWRCSENAGFQMLRLKQSPKRIFWFQSSVGTHLSLLGDKGLSFVVLGQAVPLQMPKNASILTDAGDLSPSRFFLETQEGLLEGLVKPKREGVTCQ